VQPGPCPRWSVSAKLKATAKCLQSWSDTKIGHIASQLELAKELLHQMDIAQDRRVLSPHEQWLRNNLKKHCLVLSSLSRTIAKLRSRIGLLKDGDANTALFHAQARHRKSKNFIAKILSSDSQILISHEDKAAAFFDFYSCLLSSAQISDTIVNLDTLGVTSHDLVAIDAPFSEDEV
jgi:hypothetical protein